VTALYWQIAILVSVIIGFTINNKLGYLIALGWFLHTINFMTVPSQLFFFQSSIIGFSVFICALFTWYRRRTKILEQTNEELKQRLEDLLKEYEIDDKTLDRENEIEMISGPRSHRKLLLEGIQSSETTVIILSGWLTDFAFNAQFREDMAKALRRGVNFYIGFGYKSKYDDLKIPDENMGKKNLERLRLWGEKLDLENAIKIRDYRNHAKLLLIDNKFAVCGSFNWLSNSGAGWNEEISIKITNPKLINEFSSQIKTDFRNEGSK
jgi:phosphatidylserine/phosphatidylglycerophosphate/cardiolipin synthase-like enzyme